VGVHYRQALAARWRAALIGLTLAVILVFGINSTRIMHSNIAHPPEWDFLGFWIGGRLAVQGLNFYEPENYEQVAQHLSLSDEFAQEITEVGFWYPPPSMLLFVPLVLQRDFSSKCGILSSSIDGGQV
jgi:hypothetical protein